VVGIHPSCGAGGRRKGDPESLILLQKGKNYALKRRENERPPKISENETTEEKFLGGELPRSRAVRKKKKKKRT